MSLLIVGSLAFDSVKTPYAASDKMQGGAATYSSVSASYFAKPHIVGIVGKDFTDNEFDLYKRHGINLGDVERVADGLTFFWKGYYEGDMGTAYTEDTQLNVFAQFNPKLSDEAKNKDYLFLANIDPDIQYNVLKQMKKPKLVLCDTMNFWIESKLPSLERLIREIDMFIINDGEAKLLTGESNVIVAAKQILKKYGLKYLIVKKGEHGAMLFSADSIFSIPALPLETVVDPTGAGDTFAGGLIGYVALKDDISIETIKKGMVIGTVMSSFTVSALGTKKIDKVDKNEINVKIKDYKKLIHFGEINI